MAYANWWDLTKALLRGKFMALTAYIRKQFNDLRFCHKKTEIEEQIKYKPSRRKRRKNHSRNQWN